jgi:biopolymer transport protein ExbD
MTTASVQGVKVQMPNTVNSAPLAKPQMRAITITSDGSVYLDAYPVDMATLESRLADYKSGNPELPVVLKGDASAHFDKVSEVLGICKKLDITEVGLVTKRVTE